MKKTTIITLACILSLWSISCNEDFLNVDAVGSLSESMLQNAQGAETALIGAYAFLNFGMYSGNLMGDFEGGIRGGELNKGSSAFDVSSYNEYIAYNLSNTNDNSVFSNTYTGVDKCNIVLKLCENAADLTPARKEQLQAEARFLRAVYYFHGKKNTYNIPWIDETTEDARVPNYEGDIAQKQYVDIWPNMFADAQFAMENLPPTQAQRPRPNKWAAQILLAKFYLYAWAYEPAKYADKLPEALTLLTEAINSGVTSGGLPYQLVANYHDNFDAAYEHHSEYVWGVECSILDGGPETYFSGPNSFPGTVQTGFWRDPNGPDRALGWGFKQPTEWYANHFRVDARGLPYLDMFEGPMSSQDTLKDDYGLDPAPAPFEVDTQGVDPRLDWAIGRRGIEFLGWGPFAGSAWIRAQLDQGPYGGKKFKVWKDQMGVYQSTTAASHGINMPLIRFADVLLMAAELEVRVNGDLEQARDYVNQVRARMVNNSESPRNWVKVGGKTGTVNAANYRIALWDPSFEDDPFTSAEGALEAILYERTLELGEEGTRFYDLIRFGKAVEECNTYLDFQRSLEGPLGGPRYGHYAASWEYNDDKDRFLPIPTTAIDRSKKAGVATLLQNPGY